MGLFSSSNRDKTPDCGRCGGSGVVQIGTSKWTGAQFGTCPACGGSGKK